MSVKKWLRGFSILTAFVFGCNLLTALSAVQLRANAAAGDTIVSLWDDQANEKSSQYGSDTSRKGMWVASVRDTSFFKQGTHSLRIKLGRSQDYDARFEWLGVRLYSSLQQDLKDTAALKFWYSICKDLTKQPTEIGLFCGTGADFKSIRIDLNAYLKATNNMPEIGDSNWVEVTIPFSYFAENGTCYTYDENTKAQQSASDFAWNQVSGFLIGANTQGMSNAGADSWVRLDDVRIVEHDGSGVPDPGPGPDEPDPDDTVMITDIFTERASGYTFNSSVNVSTPVDNNAATAKTGSYSQRLKLSNGGSGALEWTVLRSDGVTSLEGKTDGAALQFWYQPLKVRETLVVGVGYERGNKDWVTVRASLTEYLQEKNIKLTPNEWTLINVPLSYITAKGEYFAKPGENAAEVTASASDFNWARVGGMLIGATTEGLNGQENWCRLDDVMIVEYAGGSDPDEPDPGPGPDEPDPEEPVEGKTLITIFDEEKVWIKISGKNVSNPDPSAPAKVGNVSQRIKMAYEDPNPIDWVKIIGTPVHNGTTNQDTTALQFWYNPLLERTDMQVGLVAESGGNHESLRVPMADVLRENNITFTYGDGNWYLITIPLSYFAAHGTYYDATETQGNASAFNWPRIQGIFLGASAAGLTSQVNWFRIDAVRIVDTSNKPDPGEKQALATVPTLDINRTAVRLNQELTVQFNKPMKSSTLTPENFTINDAAVKTVKVNQDATSCTLYFYGAFGPGKKYTLHITDAVTDTHNLSVDSATRDFTFTTGAQPAMYFDGVSASAGGKELDALAAGNVTVTADLVKPDSAAAAVLAVLYQNNKLVSAQMLESNAANSAARAGGGGIVVPKPGGGASGYTGTVSVPAGSGYELRVFAWNSIAGMAAVTDAFYWNADGMGTAQSPKALLATDIREPQAAYDAQTYKLRISGKLNADDQSNVGVVIAPEALALSDVTTTEKLRNLLYIGQIPAGEGGAFSTEMTLDSKTPVGAYVVYLGSEVRGYAWQSKFYVADLAAVDKLIQELNGKELTASRAKAILEDPQLGLDLTDYNLSYVNKDTVVAHFLEMREPFADVNAVKVVFASSLGLELLHVEEDSGKLAEWIEKYGMCFLDTRESCYQKYLELSQKERIAAAEIVAEQEITSKAGARDAIIAGLIPVYASRDMNWQQLSDFLTVQEGADYVDIDETQISKNGLSESSVFKQLLKQRPFSSIADIESKYKAVITELSAGSKSGGGNKGPTGGGSGSGGGGSSIPAITSKTVIGNDNYLPPTNENQPIINRSFVDLDGVQWAKESVEYLAKMGVISQAEYFRPNDNVSREEFAKMIVTACGLPTDGAAVLFADVRTSDWFYPYVAAAQENGIVTGISETAFGTGQHITRQDMAVMIYRALQMENAAAPTGSGDDFADQSAVAGYASEAVKTMRALGIINGADDNRFLPSSFATRAQAAAMIRRALSVLQ